MDCCFQALNEDSGDFGLALYQTGRLKRLLHPRVAQSDTMFLAELLMKLPHVQIEVPVPMQAQTFSACSFGTRLLFGFRRRRFSRPWQPCSS